MNRVLHIQGVEQLFGFGAEPAIDSRSDHAEQGTVGDSAGNSFRRNVGDLPAQLEFSEHRNDPRR